MFSVAIFQTIICKEQTSASLWHIYNTAVTEEPLFIKCKFQNVFHLIKF